MPVAALRSPWGERVEVDKLRAKAEHSLIENIVKLDYRAKSDSFSEAKLARHAEVEKKQTRTSPSVARKISRLTNRWQRKQIEDGRINRVVWSSPKEQCSVSGKVWPIVSYIIKIAIDATDGDVEMARPRRRAGLVKI